MYDRNDLERLVRAARRAADKLKREYDRAQPGATLEECWAECEALWEALEPFEEMASGAR